MVAMYTLDLFQLTMSTFSTSILILGHLGMSKQLFQTISNYFKIKQTSTQFNICIVYCAIFYIKCIYSCVFKCLSPLVSVFFVFVSKLHFPFLNIKRAHKYQENIFVVPEVIGVE